MATARICVISTLGLANIKLNIKLILILINPPTPLAVERVETTKVAWTHGA